MLESSSLLKFLTVSAVLAAPTLHAQSEQLISPEATLVLDETVVTESRFSGGGDVDRSNQVTAYKTGTALKDTPQSLTIFTAEQIQQQGIDSIGDIIDYTPGVNTSQGEGHRDAIVFRGVRSTADFFVDGVRDDVQYYRSLYNVEQVEILKGPNSLTFGRGGIGGVLNRSFKRAVLGETFGEYQASIDSFGATGFQFDTNIPLGERVAARLNLHYDNLDNHRDFFDGERLGINPTFTFDLSENTQLHFAYEYADHERFVDRGIPSNPNGSVARQFVDLTFGDTELNLNELEAHTFRLSLDHDFSDNWRGKLSAFYGTYDKVYGNYFLSDFDGANEVEVDGYIDEVDRQNLTLSGDVVGEFSTGIIDHKLLIGGEFTNTSSDQFRFNNVFASNGSDRAFINVSNGFQLSNGVARDNDGNILDSGTFTDLNDDTETTINVYSAFIQDEIALHRTVDLILGARFDSFDIEVRDLAPNGLGTLTRTDEEVTPRLGLVVKPVSNLSLYGTYSESFLPRSGEQFSDLGGGADALDPDTASNLEAGIKWDIQDNLALTLAVFQIDQTSTDVSDLDAGALVEIDSEIQGFEAQLTGNITDKWFVSAGYSFLEGDQVTQSGTTDLRLRELPQNTFSLWNQYQVNDSLSLGLGVTYQDESFADNANTVTLPSYVRWDASARYDLSENYAVQLNIENLFDTEYFPNAHTANDITVGAPINARISVVGRF